MNRPLALASCRKACATSFSGPKSPVVLMMNWIGRPTEPGSGGGWNATTCAPATFWATSLWTMGWSTFAVALRWSHGFSTMPAIDWPGTSSWKTWSVSEWLLKMSKTCRE